MKSILVIGLGRFGRHVAEKLNALGHHVMAVDTNEERVNVCLPFVTSAMVGDCTKREMLSTLGIRDFDVCIVAIGDDFQSSLETTSLLKELGAKFVVARAARGVHKVFLLRNGADEVVYPEKELADIVAIKYSSDHIFDYINISDGYSIYEVETPKNWAGKNVIDLDIRRKYNLNIVAVKHLGKMNIAVTPTTLFEHGDRIWVVGSESDVQKCFKIK